MSQFIRLLVLTCWTVFLTSCGSNTGPDDVSGSGMVTTTIVGHVVDETGRSIQGAMVDGHGVTVSTNDAGVFVMRDVRVPAARCVVRVRKGSYVDGWRAVMPSANKVTMMRLTMRYEYENGTIWAPNGGYVSRDGLKMQILAAGVERPDDSIYEQRVSVFMTYHAPTSDTFYLSFPADMTAQRADGSRTEITCLGAATIKITDNTGQPLRLRTNRTGAIWFPGNGAMQDSVPLWRFDEERRLWVEQGSAYAVEGTYVAEVEQFGMWCIGVPGVGTAVLEGRVTCGNERPISGMVVSVGQTKVSTDEDGVYRQRVPAGTPIFVSVRSEENSGVSAPQIAVGPLSSDQTSSQDLLVSPCPTMLAAKIVDCNDRPTGGIVVVSSMFTDRIAASSTGTMYLAVPSGQPVYGYGQDFEGQRSKTSIVESIPENTVSDMTSYRTCGADQASYVDLRLPDPSVPIIAIDISPDGSTIAALTATSLYVVDVATGAVQWSVPVSVANLYGGRCMFVSNGDRVVLSASSLVASSSGTFVYDRASGRLMAQSKVVLGFASMTGGFLYSNRANSSDSTFVLRRYDDRTLEPQREYSLPIKDRSAWVLGYLGNDAVVVVHYEPMRVVVYDLNTGAEVRTITLERTGDQRTYVSRSGARLVTDMVPGAHNGGIGVYDLRSGRLLASRGVQGVTTAVFSPDDRLLVRYSGFGDEDIHVQDASTLDERWTMHQYQVNARIDGASTAFSAQGTRLAYVVQSAFQADPRTGRRPFSVRVYTL